MASGCGEKGSEKHPVREGIAVTVGGIEYNVFLTRQLNPRDVEDRAYYQGPEPPPGQTLYGVFLQACNRGPQPRLTSDHFKVVTTQEETFEPKPLPRNNTFAYHGGLRLAQGDCVPAEGSITELGPTAGALLLFQLPQAATENRPLELEIEGGLDVATGKRLSRAVELDI